MPALKSLPRRFSLPAEACKFAFTSEAAMAHDALGPTETAGSRVFFRFEPVASCPKGPARLGFSVWEGIRRIDYPPRGKSRSSNCVQLSLLLTNSQCREMIEKTRHVSRRIGSYWPDFFK